LVNSQLLDTFEQSFMTKLSVNINKIATLRNARGGNVPDLIQAAKDCERFGAQGITVHPRPDERHIRRNDVYELKKVVTTEFNIEGYPSKDFLQLIKEIQPAQATLVPDGPDVITSNAGWDTVKNKSFLKDVIAELKSYGARTSIFIDANEEMIEHASGTGTDRVELYTEDYAKQYSQDKDAALAPYKKAAIKANELQLGINAGHDLNFNNLRYFAGHIPNLLEVSIGHAIISDALYYGLENAIQMYQRCLKPMS
jgi:pyridoxine 5-phosphate synthase